jgi:hypothetical protein
VLEFTDSMTDEPTPALQARPLFALPLPGFWRTKTKLHRARRLQDLIRHRERWAGDIDLAQPLEKLLPDFPPDKRSAVLDQEINRLLRVVHWDLNSYGVPTAYIFEDPYDQTGSPEKKKYDIILDYFRLPRYSGREHAAFNAAMRTLNEGIGVFEAHLLRAKRDLFNPIAWAAHLIRLPITVMERAGFIGHEKTEELMLGGYAKFMKIAMSFILFFIALRLGIKVPWKNLLDKVFDFILK